MDDTQTDSSSTLPAITRQLPDPLPKIHLVAIDLDGTLLTDTKQVAQKTVNALKQVANNGVKVVIASARPPRSVRHIYSLLGLDTWQINYNGAVIWDQPSAKAVFHRPMAGALVHKIIDNARDLFEQVQVTCEIMDKWHTDRIDDTLTTETGKLFKPDVIAPLDTFLHQPITKLLLLAEPKLIFRLEAMLAEKYPTQVSMVRTDDHMIQIMDHRVSKAIALDKVARHYHIRHANIMAIGDAPNDIGMLQLAGIAVAMDNAHRSAKEVAHWIAPSNNDHGVHAALVKFGLIKK